MVQPYILILDDDINFVLEVEIALTTFNLNHKAVDNVEDFILQMKSNLPEVAVIDLYLNGKLVGFQCAEIALQYGIPVVFVTAYADQQLVNEAVKYNCYAFLNKPIDSNTLSATLELARKYQKNTSFPSESFLMDSGKSDIVFIRNNNRLDRINLREVAYISSEGNYCTIFLDSNRKFIVKTSLTQLQHSYFSDFMIRIHRNYMVHLRKIETVNLSEKWVIVNGLQFPIGRRYQNDFINQLRTIK